MIYRYIEMCAPILLEINILLLRFSFFFFIYTCKYTYARAYTHTHICVYVCVLVARYNPVCKILISIASLCIICEVMYIEKLSRLPIANQSKGRNLTSSFSAGVLRARNMRGENRCDVYMRAHVKMYKGMTRRMMEEG